MAKRVKKKWGPNGRNGNLRKGTPKTRVQFHFKCSAVQRRLRLWKIISEDGYILGRGANPVSAWADAAKKQRA